MKIEAVENYLSRCPPGTLIFFEVHIDPSQQDRPRPKTSIGRIINRYISDFYCLSFKSCTEPLRLNCMTNQIPKTTPHCL